MTLPDYLTAVNKQFKTGLAREHAYRGDLQQLLTTLCPGVLVTNEPARVACGAPDYILTRKQIPVGYIEAKDIGADLDSKGYKEQFARYKGSLDNLIITDYLQFRFFRDGEPTASIHIAEVAGGKLKPLPENFDRFKALVADFVAWQGQTITSPAKLAGMMAGKARLLADVIAQAVGSDEQTQANTNLRDQLEAFKTILIHDITPQSFADLYAQTIAYGMFAARLHDPTLEDFSRMEAAQLIPKSNPFLRKLFQSISGYDLDERIAWIVDALADIFRATDIAKLLSGFGRGSGREDAFMHFYEDFLAQYDPKLRKSRGVWYTPDPVVRFIVRAVDDILKQEFGLPMGLADASTTQIEVDTQVADKRSKTGYRREKRTVHRVQVLDPATGTGTFLAEVVRQVHAKFKGQEGLWPQYVEQHLIPRLNGFELLMASYAMAHLKLDLVLRETGYDMGQPHATPNAQPTNKEQQRLRVFLTNSLEEAHPDTGTLFASWLSQEANEANAVKRDTPVMVVLGNPPYSGISSNMGEWISSLIEDYKYVDGEHFGERKHWLHDDYVKFIRYGEHFIEKTGEGVLAYINNHGFLDNPTFRGMRWHLLNTFDKIYVIDLHGNSLKKERTPEGGRDENVFDIQQGVSINFFVRTAAKKKGQLGQVYHADLWGARENKYDVLAARSAKQLELKELAYSAPYFFFVPKDDAAQAEYHKGFSIAEMFSVNVTGIVTARDGFVIDLDRDELKSRIEDFADLTRSDADTRTKYFGTGMKGKYPAGDSRGWKLPEARRIVSGLSHEDQIKPISYRPFDTRHVYYHPNMVDWGREKIMHHVIIGPNIGLVAPRQTKESLGGFISRQIIGHKLFSAYDINNFFPLFLYPATAAQTNSFEQGIIPNLDVKLVEKLSKAVGLTYHFNPNALWAHGTDKDLTPLDVLDYCYAVLHSPAYREKYKEFLKSDFPRIPYPKDLAIPGQARNDIGKKAEQFRALVKLGARLRKLHLLEAEDIDQYITTYPKPGDNTVTRKMTKASIGWERTPAPNGSVIPGPDPESRKASDEIPGRARNDKNRSGEPLGRVWINDEQYFDGVPEATWEFYIGGYQPAQKWLKDRRDRQLSFDDIRHYQRIIKALTETQKVMEEVDGVGVV
ncbi:MAG: N-6 DNA methylase [Flavobacteriales bacterium]|nr:N-6 DNA methylase [Flavobacteriales bacterium]